MGTKHDLLIADFIARITDYGLWYLYIRDPRPYPARGWPDLTILGLRGVLYREIKTPGDVLRPMQRWVGNRLLAAGHDWAVWTRAELDSGQADAELAAIAQLPAGTTND